jgi:hypothetical protein
MRRLVYAAVVVLGACTAQHADPKVRAEQCVSEQVTSGARVSAAEARELVDKCQQAIRDWLDASMRNACRGACDYSDGDIVKERRNREEAIKEHLMMRVSDEVHPRFVRM